MGGDASAWLLQPKSDIKYAPKEILSADRCKPQREFGKALVRQVWQRLALPPQLVGHDNHVESTMVGTVPVRGAPDQPTHVSDQPTPPHHIEAGLAEILRMALLWVRPVAAWWEEMPVLVFLKCKSDIKYAPTEILRPQKA